MAPGAMAFTFIFGASSLAKLFVIDSNPPFAAAYTEKFATPLVKFVSVILIILPLLLAIIS